MNLLRCFALLFLLTGSARGQGGLEFENRVRSDAPVSLADGSGPGPTMQAGLYLVRNGGLELVGTSPFRGDRPAAEKFIFPAWITVPGVPVGAPATFRVRVWAAGHSSYEEAVAAGACHGEFPTVSGNGEVYVPALGDPNPPGSRPVELPFIQGLLPFEVPCLRASENGETLIPAIRLRPAWKPERLSIEVLTGFLNTPTILQSSLNLRDWTNITTNTPSTNRYVIELPPSNTETAHFFRSVVPP